MAMKNFKIGTPFENNIENPVSKPLQTGLFGNILKVKKWISGFGFQDGFYEGELMSGKHGLVPSNFIEKVPGKSTTLESYVHVRGGGDIHVICNAFFRDIGHPPPYVTLHQVRPCTCVMLDVHLNSP